MTGFEWHDTTCYVEYQLQASEEEMKMDPVCYSSYQNMFMYAVETFWGTPWGCDDSQVQIYLTKYYSVWRSIPSVATVSEIIAVKGLCSHPFLPSDAAFDAFCLSEIIADAIIIMSEGVAFNLEPMQSKSPLEVTLFNMMSHHAYLHVKKLRPVSALVYVGEIDSSSNGDNEDELELLLVFKSIKLTFDEDMECLSMKMTKAGLLDYNEVGCTTELITENEVVCKCSTRGFVFVTLVTETSKNLKTAVGGDFRLNVPLHILLVCHRIIAIFGVIFLLLVALNYPVYRNFGIVLLVMNLCLMDALEGCLDGCIDANYCKSHGPNLLGWNYLQMIISSLYNFTLVLDHRSIRLSEVLGYMTFVSFVACLVSATVLHFYPDLFLNYVCLPADPLEVIITPKVLVVAFDLIVCGYYLRMENHRYADEFILGIIYLLGDMADFILGFVYLVGSKSGGRLQHLVFAFAFVLNRVVINFLASLYIVFFKMSMMKFYYRLYQEIIHKRSLRRVLENEQQIKLFRLIETFTEPSLMKTSGITSAGGRGSGRGALHRHASNMIIGWQNPWNTALSPMAVSSDARINLKIEMVKESLLIKFLPVGSLLRNSNDVSIGCLTERHRIRK
ncbi:hypothetical protein Aperf_G00000001029 [Anoplocephala perfoliata]